MKISRPVAKGNIGAMEYRLCYFVEQNLHRPPRKKGRKKSTIINIPSYALERQMSSGVEDGSVCKNAMDFFLSFWGFIFGALSLVLFLILLF